MADHEWRFRQTKNSHPTMTVTMSAGRGIALAAMLLGHAIKAWLSRRSFSVTFESGEFHA